MKFKTFPFMDNIYKQAYVLCYGEFKDFKIFYKKMFGEELDTKEYEDCIGSFISEESNTKDLGIIWLSSKDPGLIAHECLHATLWVFEGIDFKITSENDEPLAWYIEYLTNTVIEFLNKK